MLGRSLFPRGGGKEANNGKSPKIACKNYFVKKKFGNWWWKAPDPGGGGRLENGKVGAEINYFGKIIWNLFLEVRGGMQLN